MKPTILCPVAQALMSKKAHDKLVVRTCAALARQGAKVVLLAPSPLPSAEDLLVHYGAPPCGDDLAVVPIARTPRFLYRRRLIARTGELEADAIYATELKVAAALVKRRRGLRARVYYEAHTLVALDEGSKGPDRSQAALEAEVMSRAEGVLVTVGTLAKALRAAYPDRAALSVVPLAAGWSEDLAGDALPPDRTPELVGYAGQLYALQGVEVLIEALARLPEMRLALVGGKPHEIRRLAEHAAKLGVTSRVRFCGYVEPWRLASFIEPIDVLLLPSRAKGRMPLVGHTKALEYLACARPIIAADLPSLREELGDGGAALFVAPEDPGAWAAAIERVASEPGMVERMTARARERARSFTWEARARAMLEAFGVRGDIGH